MLIDQITKRILRRLAFRSSSLTANRMASQGRPKRGWVALYPQSHLRHVPLMLRNLEQIAVFTRPHTLPTIPDGRFAEVRHHRAPLCCGNSTH